MYIDFEFKDLLHFLYSRIGPVIESICSAWQVISLTVWEYSSKKSFTYYFSFEDKSDLFFSCLLDASDRRHYAIRIGFVEY